MRQFFQKIRLKLARLQQKHRDPLLPITNDSSDLRYNCALLMMSKRTLFTTVTPLPPAITRESVIETLHSHVEMIDLNPLVIERHPVKPPPSCTAEEYHCIWYQLTDKVQYLPGGLLSGNVAYNACFYDLPSGLQTHVYAPLGLDIKGKWSLGGSLPGEPKEVVELGLNAPTEGLYLREDVDIRCNILLTSFVKKTLKKAHATLVDRLLAKSRLSVRPGALGGEQMVQFSYQPGGHRVLSYQPPVQPNSPTYGNPLSPYQGSLRSASDRSSSPYMASRPFSQSSGRDPKEEKFNGPAELPNYEIHPQLDDSKPPLHTSRSPSYKPVLPWHNDSKRTSQTPINPAYKHHDPSSFQTSHAFELE